MGNRFEEQQVRQVKCKEKQDAGRFVTTGRYPYTLNNGTTWMLFQVLSFCILQFIIILIMPLHP